MPQIIRAKRATKEIAQLYLNFDKKALLPKHSLPILGDRAKYSKEGNVQKPYRTFNYFSLRYELLDYSSLMISIAQDLINYETKDFKTLKC